MADHPPQTSFLSHRIIPIHKSIHHTLIKQSSKPLIVKVVSHQVINIDVDIMHGRIVHSQVIEIKRGSSVS